MGKFNVLEEKTWNNATDNEFVWKDTSCYNEENNKQASEKDMVGLLRQLIAIVDNSAYKEKTYSFGRDKIISFMLDSLFAKVIPEDIPSEAILMIELNLEPNLVHTVYQGMKNKKNTANNIVSSQKSVSNNNTQGQSTINVQYTPIVDDSKPGLFLLLAISSLVVCFYLFFKSIPSYSDPFLSMEKTVFIFSPIIALLISALFFNKYSKEKNIRKYYEVCKSMENWLGHKSDELIISWGTPSKTSKLPNDKSVTVMEYKDSVRNYTGYSTRSYSRGFSYGIHSGKSRTTKYIKTFYVKNDYIMDYKYSIQ